MATATTTNKNLDDDACASRHAIFSAVRQDRWLFIAHDQAVAKHDAAVGLLRKLCVVCDEHQGGSFAPVERDEKLENKAAVGGVEISGGFVSQQNGRTD